MMSHDAVGFYLLSQEVARHVKVVQSGQGADECSAAITGIRNCAAPTTSQEDYAKVYFDRTHGEMADALHPRT